MAPETSNGFLGFANYLEETFDLGFNHHLQIIFTKNVLETDNNVIFNFMPNDKVDFYTFQVKHELKARVKDISTLEISIEIVYDNFERDH